MDPLRWRKLEEVFRSVRQREASQRNSFLEDACGDDDELKREVEVLLAKDGSGDATLTYTTWELPPAPAGLRDGTRLSPGAQLGPYKILARIGAGGMGEVYRAHDPRLGRDVAIKVLPERLSHDPQALARFEREAKAVAALSHPNILAIFDVGSEQGVSYVVMELLEGESLRGRISRGPIPWREAVDIGGAVAEALTAAHSKGLTHRDLKPDNVFLTVDQRVKLLDFGLARWNPDAQTQQNPSPATQTLEGTILGTIGYMSPEQVRGQPVDARSDIFSFGCVLFEMVTGRRAFDRGSPAETMAAILTEEPASASRSDPPIPPDLNGVVARCLEKELRNRLQDAPDLVSTLKAIKERSGGFESSSSVAAFTPDAAIDSIAVLPFFNASNNPELEYFTDGITESLINSLSQLDSLRVIARSTAFRYKAREIDPEAVGRALNVRTLLTGRVMQRGKWLNVQSELLDVRKGAQIWGGQYNHKLTDLFIVQEVIAGEIAKKLRLKMSQEQKNRLTRRYTENPEAYQLYLRGRFYWNKRTLEGMQKGNEYFQLSIQNDPGYALAYAGVADCFALLATYSLQSPRDAFTRAKSAALKALEIDKTLAEAHASLAFTRAFYEWDWRGAQQSFKRAIEFSPSYGMAHHWRSVLLSVLGRGDEALASIRRALDLDPLSLPSNAQLAFTLYLSRRFDEAVDQAQKTLEMEPAFSLAHFFLGLGWVQKRRYDRAIASFQTAHELSGNPLTLVRLGHAYAVAGQRDLAEKTLAQLIEIRRAHYVAPLSIACIYIGLGELERVFEWMRKDVEEDRSWWLSFLNVDPIFDPIRSDPRLQALASQLKLP
jgi:eukaryotic-like serine/threonine-protein kinase